MFSFLYNLKQCKKETDCSLYVSTICRQMQNSLLHTNYETFWLTMLPLLNQAPLHILLRLWTYFYFHGSWPMSREKFRKKNKKCNSL